MNNKNTDNNRYGYPYVKNQENDILIIDTAINWGEKEKDNIPDATLNWLSFRKIVNYWGYYRLLGYCSDNALVLRWRRLISARIAAEINCPVLSSCSFVCSIPLISSCSTRTVTDWDFAFFEPVAISTPFVSWCKTVYTKRFQFKWLTCKTPNHYHVSYTINCLWCENNEAPKCGHTIEASDHNIIGANAMADTQSNQTCPKFTCLIALSNQRLMHPQRLIIILAGISFLRSVSRQEVRRG
ncbi:protein of unknown function [Xenorhabdus nematophila AN6/1]|nr:protein of unknown function [Xenorhabdus nematophila AN6/1]